MSINLPTLRVAARLLSGGGPYASLSDARALVRDMRNQADRAVDILGRVSGLDAAASSLKDIPVLVVDRVEWVAGAAQSIDSLVDDVPGSTLGLGVLFSAFSSKILGQYDPMNNRLMMVAPNITQFRSSYNLDRRDVCLWVAVHELTHAAQFAQAPWMRQYMIDQAQLIMSDGDDVPEELQNLMTLLEGHASYVMNNVPIALMPSRKRIIAAMAQRRRAKNQFTAWLRRRFNLTRKLQQYTRGEDFVTDVVAAVGLEEFNKVWEQAENLPTADEIVNPNAWISRVVEK